MFTGVYIVSFPVTIVILLFTSVVEVFSLSWLAGVISTINTISWVMFTLLLGVVIGRGYGEEWWDKMQWNLKSREMPAEEVINGAVMRFGSYLLLMPGAVTDFFGLLIIIPQTRFIARAVAAGLFKRKLAKGEKWFFFKEAEAG
nr:FxsA family protein [Nitrospina sp. Nb-3]